MKIQVYGTTPPCARCKATEKVVRDAVTELGHNDIEIEKVDVLSEEAERLGILLTPTTVVEGMIVKMGGVPSKEEVKRALEKLMNAGV
jgi:small redox-active disulfide protein 2